MNKYRAWDKENKVIRTVLRIDWHSRTVDFFSGILNRDFADIVFLQSTGLKDKNGVEIFEGDVLVEGYGFYLVTWLKEESRFMLTAEDFCLPMTSARNMKVCGNKYENPELLKEVE